MLYLAIFNAEKKSREMRPYRCSGGVTSAAIDSSKYLRICAGARDNQFALGDLNHDNLYHTWIHPSQNGNYFRKEKPHDMKSCKKCSARNSCTTVNCRLLSYTYTNDYMHPSPITCFMEKGVVQ